MLSANPSPLESYAEAVKLKEQGILAAATSTYETADWVAKAQEVARYLAAKDGETNIEIVYGKVGLPPNPNAAGSVFKGKGWKCVGVLEAVRTSRRCGLIRRWSIA